MVRRWVTVAVLAALAGGCSLLIDNAPFVGDGPADAGPTDGGREDAGPPDAGPDAPSAPEVTIAPETPRTLDDLVASITTESVDPLAMGAITYEFAWTRDGDAVTETGDTITSDQTAKGQTWAVAVTAVTTDGRRSVPATAAVSVSNTPPFLRTVGLTSYRPISGDVVEAFAGESSDDDGDAITIRYRWRVDGTEVSATGSGLRLDPATVPDGAEVTVDARAFDGEDESEPVTAGPAIVVSNTLRWVQHLPERGRVDVVTYDERHQRVLIVIDGDGAREPQLWEHDLVTDRFVQLRPSGPYPDLDFSGPTLQDPERGLVYFFVGDPFRLFELDVSTRGAERWREVTITGDVPLAPSPFVVAVAYDASTQRIIVAGPDADPATEGILWALDVSGAEATSSVAAMGQPPGIVYGAWVQIPSSDTVYVLGGGDFSGTAGTDAIHRLDVSRPEDGFEELGLRLPAAAPVPAAAVDEAGARIVFGFGFGPNGLSVLDLTTMTIEAGLASDPRLDDRMFTRFLRDTRSDRILALPAGRELFELTEYQLFGIPWTADTIEPVHAFGLNAPAPSRSLIAGELEGDVRMFGGLDRDEATSDVVWAFGVAASAPFESLRKAEIMPDATFGSPDARGAQSLSTIGDVFGFFGGVRSDGSLADTTTWQLLEARWQAFDLVGTAPASRSDAVFFDHGLCGDLLGLFGGRTASGRTNEVLFLSCSGAMCEWRAATTAGSPPAARTGAAMLLEGGRPTVIGGETGSGRVMDAFELQGCSPRTWASVALEGDVPTPRSGFTITSGPQLLFGGRTASGFDHEVYEVRRTSTGIDFTRWSPATDGDGIPAGRTNHVAVTASGLASRRMFIYGGEIARVPLTGHDRVLGDLWELRIPD